MKTTQTEPLVLSAREAAEALGICERTLRAKTQPRGPIPSVRIGNRILYPVASLQEWLTREASQNLTGSNDLSN